MKKNRFRGATIALAIPVVLLLLLVVLLVQPARAANPSMAIFQCAMGPRVNGSFDDPKCEGSGNRGWVTGKVGASKASYWLGDFIAYRAVFDDLTPGMRYCTAVNWDIAKDVLPAIDYIGTYSITLPEANPLWDTNLQGAGVTAQKFPLSVDPVLIPANGFYLNGPGGIFTGTLPYSGTAAPQGHLTGWGVSDPRTNLSFIDDSTIDGAELTNASQGVEFCFTATDPSGTAVLAWGGHIAIPEEWQAPERPPGSPYHMRTGSPDGAIPLFTDPRDSKDDLAEFPCVGDPAICDTTTPAIDADHFTIGSQDLQLGLNQEPTAITLRSVSAGGNDNNLAIALIGVATLGLATGGILVLRKREASEL